MPRFNPNQDSTENFVRIRPAKPKGKQAVQARKRKGKSEYVRNSKSPKVLAQALNDQEED